MKEQKVNKEDDIKSCILTCMTNSTGVPAVTAFTEKFQRVLTTISMMLAWVWIASVNHVTSIHENFTLATKIFVLPVMWQLEVAIHRDLPHASNETETVADDVVDFFGLRSADVVPRTGNDAEEFFRSHWTLIDFNHKTVESNGQNQNVPASIIKFLIVVVQNDSTTMIAAVVKFFLVGLNFSLHVTFFEINFDVALG